MDNALDTSSMAMFMTFPYCHKDMASEGSAQLPHLVPLYR
jgi:hypothetical protein